MTTPGTVLVMDDNADILSAARAALEARGYRVLTCGDGETGLRLAWEHAPAVVVADMLMPRRSGFVVVDRIKARFGDRVKVVMITATEGGRHQAYAEHLGVDEYIRKPFALSRLVAAVERLGPPCPAGAGAVAV